mmetsp:Transcript_5341/g.14680  ORF Transcript_5341/g.14680 Transcript_5341/m.14680 type:complete len:146 (+) Transcript_5341:928-1365(+)
MCSHRRWVLPAPPAIMPRRAQVQINMGIAEQQNTRKVSEGEKDAKIELARAERAALEELGSAMRDDRVRQSDYMLAQRYNDLTRAAGKVPEKTVYLPYEADSLGGLVGSLHKVYGSDGPRTGAPKRVSAQQIDAVVETTDDAALD